MIDSEFLCLLLVAAVPLVGALVALRVNDSGVSQRLAVVVTSLTLLLAVVAWQSFAWQHRATAVGQHDYASSLIARTGLGLDELSAPLLPLAALMFFLASIATLRSKARRFSFAGMLFYQSQVMAILSCTQPWFLIALLISSSIPPYLELRRRNKPTRVYAIHMLGSASLLLLGWSLIQTSSSGTPPWWALVPLVVGVLIRCGIAPLHCWMTDLFEHASFGTALLFVVPMVGEYAAIRLLLPVCPDWLMRVIALLALATAVYAAGMSLVQREARRFFCYLFISHSALVLVGLEALSPIGLAGALCVWLSSAISLAGLGLTLRALEARHGRLSLVRFHGMYEHTPLLAICFFITGMASVGFPGTLGFAGMEMLVDGAVQAMPYVGAVVIVAAALNGIAVVQAYFKLFTGTRTSPAVPLQVTTRERWMVAAVAILLLGGAIYPQPGVRSRAIAAEELLGARFQSSRVLDRTLAGTAADERHSRH
jgi:NADH-quinone oxidoreductase subunit M